MTDWLPDMIYLHGGDVPATRLRGLAYYRAMVDEFHHDDGNAEFVGRVDIPAHEGGNHNDMSMWLVASRRLRGPRPGMLRVLAPSRRKFVDTLEQHRETSIIIIDVYHPVDTPDETFVGIETDPALTALDLELTRHAWAPGGEAHTQLTRALRFADAVTCPPNPHTIGDARTYNDHVWVVPDLRGDSEEEIQAFHEALLPATLDAGERFGQRQRGSDR